MSDQKYMNKRFGTFILRLCLMGILVCLCACSGDGQKEPEKTVPVPGPESKEVVRHALTYHAGANGGISGEKNQIIVEGEDGSEVTAVPDEGYHFAGWSDGVEKASRVDRRVKQDLSAKAEFAVKKYQLTYQTEGKGSLEGPVRQTVSHGEDGETVTAVPAANHHFTGWSDGLGTARRHETNVTSDLSLTAKFAIDRFALSYAAGRHGSIKGEKQQVVDYGGSGRQVRAVPDEGYHFTGWSDGVETALRSEENVTGDLEVTANFAVNVYSLVYTSGEHGDISGEKVQKVEHGGDGTAVTAVAEPGYHFVQWSDGANGATRSEQNITRDLSFRAFFEVNTYSVGGRLSGLVEGTRVALQLNENPVLVLEREGEFTFPAEMLDGEPYVVTVSVQPVSPNQICTVDQGSGAVSGADVEDVQVECQLETYKVGGTLAGLPEGANVLLEINDKETLQLQANGVFSFDTPLEDGSAYRVSVSRPPSLPNWVCDLENEAGSLAGKDVGDILVDCYVKPVLRAIPGLRSISLDWNYQDFQQVTFNLCRAQAEIPPDGFGRCQSLAAGMLASNVSSPYFASSLASDEPYWFQLEAHYAGGRKVYSEVVESMAFGGLNDSGVDWCADKGRNIESDGTRKEKGDSCHDLAGSFPGQDAHFGRDARARSRELKMAMQQVRGAVPPTPRRAACLKAGGACAIIRPA